MCQMDMQSGTVFCLFRLSNPPTPSPLPCTTPRVPLPLVQDRPAAAVRRPRGRRGAPASACGHSAIALMAAFEVVILHEAIEVKLNLRWCFPFLLDEKPIVVLVGSAGERPGGARSVQDRTACSNSERAGAVGLRWQAVFGSSANGKTSHPEIRDSMSRSRRVHLLQNRSHLVPFSSRPGAAYEIQK
jgi:hypothetical protein